MSERSYPQWRREFGVEMPSVERPPLPVEPPEGVRIRDWAQQPGGTLWAATDDGLWHYRNRRWARVEPWQTPYPIPPDAGPETVRALAQAAGLDEQDTDGLLQQGAALVRAHTLPRADVRGVAVDAAGGLWVATAEGLVVGDGQGTWYTLGAMDGLPYADVRGVAAGPDGSVWPWFGRGVARLCEGRWILFSGPRWLPSDAVRAVVIDGGGTAWVETDAGTAHVYPQSMTLAQKAAYYEDQVAARHERQGYVAGCHLSRPGDLDSAVYRASDNDGLWTAMYVAAESYRYAVTGETEARERARRSMQALLFLEEVTPISGFPARAVVLDDKEVLRSDPERGEWHPFTLPDGRLGQWKGDTSSDEIVGHIYGLSIYHDLAADEADKKAIAATVTRIADHIVSHGYYLIDLDGKPTTWGIWAPNDLNGDLYRMGDRGLNSLEILALLRAAHHVTGEARFLQSYHELIAAHGYALNVVGQRHDVPGHVNHSDDELAFLSYYPLLRYEDDPALRALYLRGLERAWQLERAERCPLWNFMYGALTGRHCDADAATAALAEIPLDLVYYAVDQTGRLDVTERAYADRHRHPQAERPLPWLERPLMKWNGNPYNLRGGNGVSEEAGTFWLLPYWMGRYYGFV
jgi:hypothetical protein